jgi:hypothetical protein
MVLDFCNLIVFITKKITYLNPRLFMVNNKLMKKLLSLLAIILVLNSCAPLRVVNSKPEKARPGQVEKVAGSQSAKRYAPAHQNKKN